MSHSIGRLITGEIGDQIADPVASLETRLARLQEALEARDRFLSIAAHELRNPMQPLVLQVGLLLKSARRGELSKVIDGLELLETIVGRYVKRANVLLDVTRLAADRVKLEPVPIDLSACVRKVVESFMPMAEQAGSALRLTVLDDVNCVMDPMAIEQILENLISNAIKFGAGLPVTVSLTRLANEAVLAVSDNGPGIAAEDQVQIFAPFEKVMARAEGGGFGVGLWVVSRLVAEMNGAVELDSAPGNGATFRVTLPLRNSQDENDPK